MLLTSCMVQQRCSEQPGSMCGIEAAQYGWRESGDAQPQGDSRAGCLERSQQHDALLRAMLVLKWHTGSCLLWWIC